MIKIDEDWYQYVTEKCAEAMTALLLESSNPKNNGEYCGCLNCLSRLAVEIVMEELKDESDKFMMEKIHKENMESNNIN